ncbi:5-azacytidine-induced protein 2 isoform X2 [Rhinatrema bivittatum]|nr:5-azacytidine-induced protein 2 isoform X2 [Rhinatrema bivittatum]XP_029445285.1 5-azacytidine-induced protein 2 isoform X2 [Rhinatrema bivittatum]
MDTLVDDDISILNHENAESTEKTATETPISALAGDESVASHFALTKAYEDIKKRLKETEKENSLLKKRIRLLEEKLLYTRLEEEPSTIGREQVNKAYHAYREVCIERDNLKNKLDKMVKDSVESMKTLNEQLQTKEIELLQLKTEVETQQVIKDLSRKPYDYEINFYSLAQELWKMDYEAPWSEIQSGQKKPPERRYLSGKDLREGRDIQSVKNVQYAYQELKREMSNLHLVTGVQAEVLRKLRASVTATKKVSQCTPVQCMEDLERDSTKVHPVSSSAVYKKQAYPSQEDQSLCHATASPSQGDVRLLSDRVNLRLQANERLSPLGGSSFQEHNSYGKSSLEENSWVFPSPPKPSNTLFWESNNNSSSFNYPGRYFDKQEMNNHLKG